MLGRGIHDVDPNRQRELASKRAAINLLRLVEACPDGAGEIGIVPGKQRIGKIVGGAGFTCRREFSSGQIVCRQLFPSLIQAHRPGRNALRKRFQV